MKSYFLSEAFLKAVFFGETDLELSHLKTLYISLHFGAPNDSQTQNEVMYPGYCRIATSREKSDWIFVGREIWNAKPILFAPIRNYNVTISHFAVGLSSVGSGKVLLWGELEKPLAIGRRERHYVPAFEPGNLTFVEE